MQHSCKPLCCHTKAHALPSGAQLQVLTWRCTKSRHTDFDPVHIFEKSLRKEKSTPLGHHRSLCLLNNSKNLSQTAAFEHCASLRHSTSKQRIDEQALQLIGSVRNLQLHAVPTQQHMALHEHKLTETFAVKHVEVADTSESTANQL